MDEKLNFDSRKFIHNILEEPEKCLFEYKTKRMHM